MDGSRRTESSGASRSTSTPTGSRGPATTTGAGRTGSGGSGKPTALATLSETATEALEARGLDSELCVRLGITSASVPGGDDLWVAIPFRKAGKIVNHKYRRVQKGDGPTNFMQDRGGDACWWNFDCLTDKSLDDQPLIVTEGEFDAIAAMQAGYQRVVSVPNGAPGKELGGGEVERYAFVASTIDMLRDVQTIILAADNDSAGIALLNDLSVRLGRGRCRYAVYRDGVKDLNDQLLGWGQAGVVEAISGAKWVRVKGLFRMSDLPPLADAEPHASGIHGMHEHYRLRLGDFCVVTGIPGSGKSTFVNDLCCRMAERSGWPTCFASFEQNPQLDHKRALTTWVNRKPMAMQSDGEREIAGEWIDTWCSFVVPDDEEDADVEWVLDKCASAVVRYGAKIVVIDPWNELDHARPKDMTLTEYVGVAIRQFKRFARRWNVHLIIVAHPTKLSRSNDGSLPMPSMYDISDSANWANKADVGVIVHRGEGKLTTVKVAKSRYHDTIGKPGSVELMFNSHSARFDAP